MVAVDTSGAFVEIESGRLTISAFTISKRFASLRAFASFLLIVCRPILIAVGGVR